MRARCGRLSSVKGRIKEGGKRWIYLVLTQKNVEGKLEEVDPTQEGKDHAKDPTNIYERI